MPVTAMPETDLFTLSFDDAMCRPYRPIPILILLLIACVLMFGMLPGSAQAALPGHVRAMQRADNAGPHTLEASRLKAYTSASARNTTLAMMEAAQKNPAAANLKDIPGFLLLGGGVPVRAGTEVIGAVGVGGAPGGHLDEQCAMAALEQVKAALQ